MNDIAISSRATSPATAPAGRQHFTVSRAIEFFTARELEAQTGQPMSNFAPAVAPKELLDNALDGAERAGRAPEVEIAATFDAKAEGMVLVVNDNGDGIPHEVVSRILDFTTRTSDKAAYRGPCRGAQGNALKTIIGVPVALGSDRTDLTITSQGIQHRIAAWLDPSQTPRIELASEPAPGGQGTSIRLSLPDYRAAVADGLDRLAFAYHALNPHAEIKICLSGTVTKQGESIPVAIEEFYLPTDTVWAKYRSCDPEAPHWHDADSFARLVQLSIHAGDEPLRAFVRRFRGLTGSAKAKAVCNSLPWTRLSDLDGNAEAAADLLVAMQGQTQAPAPAVLGIIGEEHLRRALAARYDLVADRFWYRKATGTPAEPYVFEVALTEIRAKAHDHIYGLNFSPAFADPFASVRFEVAGRPCWGLRGILNQCHADRQHYALVVNLTAPGLRFLDRGKSRLALSDPELIAAVGKALATVLKVFHAEGEAARKDALRQSRADERRWSDEKPTTVTMRDAVFQEIAKAVRLAAGDGSLPVSMRSVFYKIRPLLAHHTNEEMNYNYFTQTLIPDYQTQFGKIPNLYADPRGYFYHPHDGKSFPISDYAIEGYSFPFWQFERILFIEKKGLYATLKEAKLGERYDMAIVASEGFATVAMRTLLAKASRRKMQVFCLHDCDLNGYSIARTLGEATRRMPNHAIEVIDLGLRLDQAREMGLEHEETSRRLAPPATLNLTNDERAFFTTRTLGDWGKEQWIARRVELDAMTAPQLVQFIEDGLKENGADAKLIPPEEVLHEAAAPAMDDLIWSAIRAEIHRQLDLDAMATRVWRDVAARRPLRLHPQRLKRAVAAAFNPEAKRNADNSHRAHGALHKPWSDPLKEHIDRHFQSADLPRLIRASVTAALARAQHIAIARA